MYFIPFLLLYLHFSKIMAAPNLSYSPTAIACTPTHTEMPGSWSLPE